MYEDSHLESDYEDRSDFSYDPYGYDYRDDLEDPEEHDEEHETDIRVNPDLPNEEDFEVILFILYNSDESDIQDEEEFPEDFIGIGTFEHDLVEYA